uniref:Uncharacterized protein n=1 Tax=Pyrodinium bahamense TaxID=73915 RepID=A0A7S0F7Q6_9DINO|mmetsp:Transcript_10143/g.28324  ORF Transcript_10143/g.28324 Transcript_10143/m.28324 type:complete len:328 (+) Transcript_10143:141-1124(+)
MAAKPARGPLAPGRQKGGTQAALAETIGKVPEARAVDEKTTNSKAGALLVDGEDATGLVLADGTQVLLAAGGADSGLAPPAADAKSGAACADGKVFGVAPHAKGIVETGAVLGKEYFVHDASGSDAPPSKRLCTKSGNPVSFSPGLLEKAPSSVQTCRSLLQFLEKRLEVPRPEAPEADGPKDLLRLLVAHADRAGRLAALKECASWDTRAKRIIDLVASAASPMGVSELAAASKRVEDSEAVLEQELKERGEVGVNALIKERIAWAKECVRREWFEWCARLLRAREATLLAGTKAGVVIPRRIAAPNALDATGVLKALLHGSLSGS